MSTFLNNVKSLRKNLTEAEKLLWKHLRAKNLAEVFANLEGVLDVMM
jgi:very-short-patch-repair endonuclease